MHDDDHLDLLAREIGELLRAAGLSLATAESCTGGWIAAAVTSVAGSSDWFDRGFVTYSNAAKHEMLGVPRKLLEASGAVSEPVVLAMTSGALERSSARVAVAVSGIAGPAGGSADKPVGTVWFAWQRLGRPGWAQCERFSGDRQAIRRQAVARALRGIRDVCPD